MPHVSRASDPHAWRMDYVLRATTTVPASTGDVFDYITDIARLPDWNHEIRQIVDAPATVEVGAEWVVEIHAMKTHWTSRSKATRVDRGAGVFEYRSQSDDGNPSHADWRWTITAMASRESTVAVEVEIHPRTFLRRWLLSEARKPTLRKSINQSLAALREHAANNQEVDHQ
jgi:uncharacterized protein YndB with AHSA1/START domain